MDSYPGKGQFDGRPSTFRRHAGIWSCFFVVPLLALIILIPAFTVFKPRKAVTTVNSVKLKGMQVSLDPPRLHVDLNFSLEINITVKNPNYVSFRYRNSSASLFYRGNLVGEALIPAGKISARQTKAMNVTLVIMADELLAQSNLYLDVVAGTLLFKTTTRVSGKVILLEMFKIHVVSYSYCDVAIDVWKKSVSEQSCTQKTEL